MIALFAVALVALFVAVLLAAFAVLAVADHLAAITLALQAQNRHYGIDAPPDETP